MPAVRASEMATAVLDAFKASGASGVLSSPSKDQPRKFVVQTSAGSKDVWIYIWTLTHGGRPSLPDEYRIQMTGVLSPLEMNPDGYTVLAGYEPNLRIFAGFDLRQHSTFTTGSPSVQIDVNCLRLALDNGLAFDRKDNSEIVVGIRPDNFLKYILASNELHEHGTLSEDFGVVSDETSKELETEVLPKAEDEPIDGLDLGDPDELGDYPIDSVLIRQETRTVFEIVRRIKEEKFILDPDFQREFIWSLDKQSKLIESTLLRIPLPVIYLAEREDGKSVVVDGLQRLTTFTRYLSNEFGLRNLAIGSNLNTVKFFGLPPKLQNRIEDAQLILYLIDSKVPEQARLDIFERVNGGVPLSRQQMRNCIYMGPATRWLKEEANERTFIVATGGTLSRNTMRDRECINRFCAFDLLGEDSYKRGDMDAFLAEALRYMNKLGGQGLIDLSGRFRRSMYNNSLIFSKHAFRKHRTPHERRSVINVALFDVLSVLLSRLTTEQAQERSDFMRDGFYKLMSNGEFYDAISLSTNSSIKVKTRFRLAREYLGIF